MISDSRITFKLERRDTSITEDDNEYNVEVDKKSRKIPYVLRTHKGTNKKVVESIQNANERNTHQVTRPKVRCSRHPRPGTGTPGAPVNRGFEGQYTIQCTHAATQA